MKDACADVMRCEIQMFGCWFAPRLVLFTGSGEMWGPQDGPRRGGRAGHGCEGGKTFNNDQRHFSAVWWRHPWTRVWNLYRPPNKTMMSCTQLKFSEGPDLESLLYSRELEVFPVFSRSNKEFLCVHLSWRVWKILWSMSHWTVAAQRTWKPSSALTLQLCRNRCKRGSRNSWQILLTRITCRRRFFRGFFGAL